MSANGLEAGQVVEVQLRPTQAWREAVVVSVGDHRIEVEVDGRRMRAGLRQVRPRRRTISLSGMAKVEPAEERREIDVRPRRVDLAPSEQAIELVRGVVEDALGRAYLDWIRSLPCCACHAPPPSDPHHYGPRVGRKASDYRAVPLCRPCHDAFHAKRCLGRMDATQTREFLILRQVDLLSTRLMLREFQATEGSGR